MSFMSFKSLMIFITVYKEESITAAAEKLSISQPAVSAAIRELERRYDIQLFQRSGRGIRRSRNAERFFDYASHIVSLCTEMDETFHNIDREIPLRIGSSISIGACLMPECIKSYMHDFQTPMPYLKIDSSENIENMILDDQLDFAFIEGTIHSSQILSEPVIRDHLIIICSPIHPLTHKTGLTLDDLREEPFLLREKNSGTRELAESVLRLHDFSLHPAWESTSTTAIINGVIAGLGMSILPARMLTDYLRTSLVSELKIPGISFEREYYMIYHQHKFLNARLTHAMDHMKNTIQKSSASILSGS